MPDEISPCPPAPPSPGGCWRGTQTGRDLSVWGPMSNVLGSIREDGTGHVVLSSISRQISTSRHSTVVAPDAQRDSRWAGKIRSGRILRHILNGTGPATNPGGSFRRASCQLARSGPRFRSPMKHGTRGQAGSLSYGAGFRRSRHAIPRLARELGCGQNLPAGGHGSPAGRKRIPAGGGDPFSHRGKKDPRQPWGVMPGPSTGRDGPGNWDGTEVADRLPAKPADSSEATGTVGQVDPPGQQKVVPP